MRSQILVDDEWHLVHKLRGGAELASLLGDFGGTDHSIGLSLCAWLLARVTILDETLLRVPSLVAGLALIVLVPALLARHTGRAVAIASAWLLAVSPLLCFFSRLARPYAVTALLAPIAGLAFLRWYATGSRRAHVCHVAAAVVAPVFSLPAVPAVLAPYALPLVARGAPRPEHAPSLREVATSFLTVIAMLGLVLALPAFRSGAVVAARLNADRPGPATLPVLLELLAGSAHPAIVAVVAVVAAIGLAALARRERLLARLLLLTIATQTVAVVASGAAQSHVPAVAARYLAVVIPHLWILAAAGVVAAGERLGLRRPHALGALVALALLAQGPLSWVYTAANDFTNHVSYQADYQPGRYFERFRPHTISAFYEQLAARPPASTVVVEAPWYSYFHPFAYTQRIHRQHVVIGFVDERSDSPRPGEIARDDPTIHLRNALFLGDRRALKDRGVEFVILHRDLLQEIDWLRGVSEVPIPIAEWEERYRAWFGAPVFEDARLMAFAVR